MSYEAMNRMYRYRDDPDLADAKAGSYKYVPPEFQSTINLSDLLAIHGRTTGRTQGNLFDKNDKSDPEIYYSGNLNILDAPNVAVIGSRKVSLDGQRRALRLARELAASGVTVTSGLAKGVDTNAHRGALAGDGKTIAVIGTPLDRCYPAENKKLQQEIYEKHLLISQFMNGTRTYPSDFPRRNRLMAALTDASVIIEASDTSGTLHQAAECVRLDRWLFILRSVAENPALKWPKQFLKEKKVAVLTAVEDILDRVS